MGSRLDSSIKCELNLKQAKLGGAENSRKNILMSDTSAVI